LEKRLLLRLVIRAIVLGLCLTMLVNTNLRASSALGLMLMIGLLTVVDVRVIPELETWVARSIWWVLGLAVLGVVVYPLGAMLRFESWPWAFSALVAALIVAFQFQHERRWIKEGQAELNS
jgi:uncharacterized membrane protein YczE